MLLCLVFNSNFAECKFLLKKFDHFQPLGLGLEIDSIEFASKPDGTYMRKLLYVLLMLSFGIF